MIYLILLLGLSLRLISLNQSFWLDEATSGLMVKNFSFAEIISKFSPGDFHPPLYYLALKAWASLFGTSEVGLRLFSVACGIATIYLIYKLAGRIPALLLATSGLHLFYSQEARMYSLITLLVTCLVYLFIKKKWFLFSVTLALVGMTDYPALLMLPVFWLAGRRDWRKLVLSSSLLVISYFFWLPILLRQFSSGFSASQSAWGNILGKFSLKEVALIPVKFMLGKISFDNKVIYALAVGIAGLVFGYLIFKGFKKAGPWLRLWLVVPIALAVLVSFRLPILGYFRLLFVLPAFYLLLARGIESLPKNWRVVGLMFILFINLTSSILYLASPRFHREDWRGAADAVGDEKIIFPAKSQKEALIYYGREKQIIDIDELKGEENPIWLSRYIWEVFDPTDAARKKVESLGYNKVSVSNFNGVILFKYAYRD